MPDSDHMPLGDIGLPPGTTGVVTYALPDDEVNTLNLCLAALRGLDANAAARVAHYLADRHPFVGTMPSAARAE